MLQSGKPVADSKRELIIGKGARGCVPLYCYVEELDVIFVLTLRSQREAGYKEIAEHAGSAI